MGVALTRLLEVERERRISAKGSLSDMLVCTVGVRWTALYVVVFDWSVKAS